MQVSHGIHSSRVPTNCETRDFVLVVKRNQPRLHAVLRALPWRQCTAVRYDREQGHGRRETRSVCVLTVTAVGLDFPHVAQAVKIHRYRTDVKSGKTTRQTVYAITDMTSRHDLSAGLPAASRATRLPPLGHRVRAPWASERGHTANLAVNTLRDAGYRSITVGLRQASYAPFTHPLDLLRLA
ncbi:hypothetical protein ACFV2N_42995 [Streptomyces sp. NPDC059680]|uniref:hypothetical protein n=1 Tax=Streptomyces sp. NPDC059680 TaxID=3346904 RepID=UPI003675137F